MPMAILSMSGSVANVLPPHHGMALMVPVSPKEDAMFDVTATINTDTDEYDDMPYKGTDLNNIWEYIKQDYPTVTSVVLVFSNPER